MIKNAITVLWIAAKSLKAVTKPNANFSSKYDGIDLA